MSTPAELLATWTALCGTDSAVLEADCQPFIKSLGVTTFDYSTLSEEDKAPFAAVDKSNLYKLQSRIAQLQKALSEALKVGRTSAPSN